MRALASRRTTMATATRRRRARFPHGLDARAAAGDLPLRPAHPLARGAAGQPLPAVEGRRRALPLAGAGGGVGGQRLRAAPPRRRHRRRALAADPQPRLHARDGRPPGGGAPPVHGQGRLARRRGKELNIHFTDYQRGFIGQISPLGDLVPVMAGVTLTFRQRGEDRVGMVYLGDGATSTGAFHEGINFAAVQRCPLVVVVENNHYAYSTPTLAADAPPSRSPPRRRATGSPASRWTATTCWRSTAPPAGRWSGRAAARASPSWRCSPTAGSATRSTTTSPTSRRRRSSAGRATNDPLDRYVATPARERLGRADAQLAGGSTREVDARARRRRRGGRGARRCPSPRRRCEDVYADVPGPPRLDPPRPPDPTQA